MDYSIQRFQSHNLSRSYFVGKPDENAGKIYLQEHFSIIRTAEHFQTCKNAMSAHVLDCYMLCLVKSGEGIYHFGTESYSLKAPTLCFIPPWTLTSWQSQTPWQEGFCCTFSASFFNSGLEDRNWLKDLAAFGNVVHRLEAHEIAYFSMLFEDMLATANIASQLELLKSQLRLVMRKAASLFPNADKKLISNSSSAIKLTKQFLDYCHSDFEKLLRAEIPELPALNEHAARLNVSANHLNDTIKAVTGKSVGQHVQKQLIKHANALLKQMHWNIGQIATQLGFKSAAYFARFYKKHTGYTPLAFRMQNP